MPLFAFEMSILVWWDEDAGCGGADVEAEDEPAAWAPFCGGESMIREWKI
jgi:hypothetical protein